MYPNGGQAGSNETQVGAVAVVPLREKMLIVRHAIGTEPEPVIDAAKAPCAAMTMVRGDNVPLKRWLAHYRRFLPDEHIYVLTLGDDQQIADIARGVNVIRIPAPDAEQVSDERCWQFLSQVTSGLTQFYNWVICNDVSDCVVLDPDAGTDLVGYLMDRRAAPSPPHVIIPFPIEMVPAADQADAGAGSGTVGMYRLNSRFAKPCITSVPVEFRAGGQVASIRNYEIATQLYNFHLDSAEGGSDDVRAAHAPGPSETIDHPEFRRKMIADRIVDPPWTQMGGGRSAETFRLPERFSGIF